MASSQPLLTGTLRVITAASDPSAKNQLAFGLTPTSRNSVESITPVHSLWLVNPQISCGVISSLPLLKLPEQSRKNIYVTEGKSFRSARENVNCLSTIPC